MSQLTQILVIGLFLISLHPLKGVEEKVEEPVLTGEQAGFYSKERVSDTRRFMLPLNNPSLEIARDAHFMKDEDIVLGVSLESGSNRAYPWWIAKQYHVINDAVKDSNNDFQYITITLCEVCSGASAFESEILDNPYVYGTFYVCGAKFDEWGTFEICDVETHSRWHPFRGEAVSGPLVGKRLSRLPLFVGTWREWTGRHPDSMVALAGEEVRRRKHTRRDLVPGGASSFGDTSDKSLQKNELVYSHFGVDLAYPLSVVRLHGGILFDPTNQTLLIQNGEMSVLGFDSEVEGVALTGFQRFAVESGEFLFTDSSQTLWNQSGVAIAGPLKGQKLEFLSGYVSEWFEFERISENPKVYAEKLEWQPLTGLPTGGLRGERPIIVDFWAEWCAPCHEFEERVFSDPRVQAKLGQFALYRVDVTEESAASNKLKQALQVAGLPSLRFLSPDGELLLEHSIYGFLGVEEFLAHLDSVLDAAGPESE